MAENQIMVDMGQKTSSQVGCQRVVVKVGTSTLTKGGRCLSRPAMLDICQQVVQLCEKGHEVVIVCSGSVAAGREVLGEHKIASTVPAKQMLSSIGQVRLMHTWTELFGIYQRPVGQVLLGRGDCIKRRRYLNVRDTLESLLAHGVIPIINENDPVVTDELCFGDNDNLAALVANLIASDLLILVTDQEGLFTGDPRSDPTAILVSRVEHIDDTIWKSARNSGSGLGTGGMFTKLEAAKLAADSGTPTVISSLQQPNLLLRATTGAAVGTRIEASASKKESRKRWLLTEPISGTVVVDEGAGQRIVNQGASLLPVGVVNVEGTFERGAIVNVQRSTTTESCAKGIVNYSSEEIRQVMGKKTSELSAILGYSRGDVVIHRDNMVSI